MRFAASALFSLLALNVASAQDYPIAGVTPDQRPAGAPVIKEVQKDAGWNDRYLHGVTKPYPDTLGLKDQGAWYTPFNHPGMLAPYDIRGWHAGKKGAQAPAATKTKSSKAKSGQREAVNSKTIR